MLEAVERILPAVNATRYIAGEFMTQISNVSDGQIPAASLVTVLYDWLLTLGDEVELIYPAPWSIVKFLYIFVSMLPCNSSFVLNRP